MGLPNVDDCCIWEYTNLKNRLLILCLGLRCDEAFFKMQAIRVHPTSAPGSAAYSVSNPAPPSALSLDSNIPIPKLSKPGEILIQVKAASVVRHALNWPETYIKDYVIPGHDVSGIVVQVYDGASRFQPGDDVFGSAHPDLGSTWAEYAILNETELALKPKKFSWEEAAAVPLSALTAYQALCDHGGLTIPYTGIGNRQQETSSVDTARRVLISGAAGAVGMYLVQFSALVPNIHVTAATSSSSRNEALLKNLGSDDVVEYNQLSETGNYDIIIDTIGGSVLAGFWKMIRKTGILISVESSSFDFVDEHNKHGLRKGKEDVKALFFIYKPNGEILHQLARLADLELLKPFVAATYPMAEATKAYEHANQRFAERGKVILTV